VDYTICGIVKYHVYQSCVQNVNELKQHLLNTWYIIEQSIIDSAIDEWRMSLQFAAEKENFEQML